MMMRKSTPLRFINRPEKMKKAILLLSILALPLLAYAQETMTYEEAIERIPNRDIPAFWIGKVDGLSARLDTLERGDVRVIAVSPGGRPIHLVTYGDYEPAPKKANYNSAMGAGDAAYYADKSGRQKPVILFVGPVHGQETEGLTGLVNLIHIMETGYDLAGRDQSRLRKLAEQTRMLIIPTANPDGVARFVPQTLIGMELADLQFWGQGTWNDGTLIGWPDAKQQHPMKGDNVGFRGCYFNDAGVNPMHDEFFRPMSTEAPAILDLARSEAPDLAVSLHSHAQPPVPLRPAYVPLEVQQSIRVLAAIYFDLLEQRGLPRGSLFEPRAESGTTPFNLVSAIYHVSGASVFTHECPHGLSDYEERMGQKLTLTDILDLQLALYEAMLQFALQPE